MRISHRQALMRYWRKVAATMKNRGRGLAALINCQVRGRFTSRKARYRNRALTRRPVQSFQEEFLLFALFCVTEPE